jgi:hypothetical protein
MRTSLGRRIVRGVEEDCDHDFVAVEVNADQTGARIVLECTRCGGTAYEASRSDRPGLGTGDGT